MIKLSLFLLTVLTLTVAGATFEIGGNVADVWQAPELLGPGLYYTAAVLLVLFVREIAHALTARRHGVRWSPPYLVPVPNSFGALGALHPLEQAPSRRALFDIAAASALAGAATSAVLAGVGLHLSDTLDSPQVASPSLAFGQPLLFQALVHLLKPEALEVGAAWHPLAFAGWTGLLMTAVQLLPLGQLDGGHIAYALVGRRQSLLASAALATLVGVGLAQQASLWIIWVLVMLLIGHRHPPLPPDERLSRGRVVVGLCLLVVLALCFTVLPTGGWARRS